MIIETEEISCPVCSSTSFKVIAEGKDYEYDTCDNVFNIVKCKCGHIYLNPRPKRKELEVIYPNNYYAYDFLNDKFSLAKLGKKRIDKKCKKLYLKLMGKRGRILEVGSGDGRLLSILKENTEWKLEGIDFNKKGNKLARKKGLKIYDGIFEEMKFKDNSFDLIIMNEVLEHVFNPEQTIKKAKRILKPQGHLIIETPCLDSIKNKYWGGYHIPRHFNLFNENIIRKLLNDRGFKVIIISYLLSPAFWILSIHNCLKDKKFPKWIVRRFNFYNPVLLFIFSIVDIIRRKTSTMRIIARC